MKEMFFLKISGVEITLVCSNFPLPVKELSAGESRIFTKFKSPVRRREWLAGRAALKILFHYLEEDADTSRLSFPHPRFSLAHSGGRAAAAGVTAGNARGVGVDLEAPRAFKPESRRFFLHTQEFDTCTSDWHSADLLRLWTVKESLFKSNPHNRGTTLRQYRVLDPGGWTGKALTPQGSPQSYTSLKSGGLFFSAAVTL